MKLRSLFEQVRAAHSLARAFDNGKQPRARDLKALGLDETFATRFVR